MAATSGVKVVMNMVWWSTSPWPRSMCAKMATGLRAGSPVFSSISSSGMYRMSEGERLKFVVYHVSWEGKSETQRPKWPN